MPRWLQVESCYMQLHGKAAAMKCQSTWLLLQKYISNAICHLGLWQGQAHLWTPLANPFATPYKWLWPLANGFSSEFATQGHLVLGPLVPGLGPGAFKSWLDASLTAFGVPPAPHTAKWASGAWCAIIAKVLGLGLASFWARLGNCLGNSILYFWCSSGFCLGTCFGGCFGLAFGTSFCFGQFVESILLILGQIIGLWCLHLPWQWLTITWDAMLYMANNYDALRPQSPIQ